MASFFSRYYCKAMYPGAFLWKPYISLLIPSIILSTNILNDYFVHMFVVSVVFNSLSTSKD